MPLGNEIGRSVPARPLRDALRAKAHQSATQEKRWCCRFAHESSPYILIHALDIDPQVLVSGIDRALEIHPGPAAAVASGRKLFPNLDPAVDLRASVQRLIGDGVFADSVAVPEQALSAPDQIDLGDLDASPMANGWISVMRIKCRGKACTFLIQKRWRVNRVPETITGTDRRAPAYNSR